MLREDNYGFVSFPSQTSRVYTNVRLKTIVYLIVFDIEDINGDRYILSNNNLEIIGDFVSDDITKNNTNPPYIRDGFTIPLTTSICLGWSNHTYSNNDGENWSASFNNLTNEGKKLYYSIRKLHNNKEIRIITLNNI